MRAVRLPPWSRTSGGAAVARLVGPPLDQVEADAVGDHVVLEREADVVDGESGAADPGPQVVERRRRHWMTSPPFTFIVSPTT